MATNKQIVMTDAIANGIYTQEQLDAFLLRGLPVPLFTFGRWAEMGYTVKKGQHAAMISMLWKMRDGKKTDDNPDDVDPETDERGRDFYLHKVFLFDFRQVQKMTPEEIAAYRKKQEISAQKRAAKTKKRNTKKRPAKKAETWMVDAAEIGA